MVRETGEQLSAFLDDELDGPESGLFLRRLARDDVLRETALRYTLIGDALRGDVVSDDPRRMSRALRDATAHEAGGQQTAAPGMPRWLRPLAGAAVAASVAAVAVLGLRNSGVDELEGPAVTVPVAAGDAAGSSHLYTVPEALSRKASTSPDRLSEYYLNHSEYATLLRGQGPLIRIVTTPAQESDPAPGDETVEGEEQQREQAPAQ